MLTMGRSDIYQLLPMCDLYIKVRIKVLGIRVSVTLYSGIIFTLYIKIKVSIFLEPISIHKSESIYLQGVTGLAQARVIYGGLFAPLNVIV